MPKSGRWRWKFQYNNRVLARGDYHYATPAAAEKSFRNLINGATNHHYSTLYED